MDYKWELGRCKLCGGKMIKETIVFTNPRKHRIEVWVCKRCGFVRRF